MEKEPTDLWNNGNIHMEKQFAHHVNWLKFFIQLFVVSFVYLSLKIHFY